MYVVDTWLRDLDNRNQLSAIFMDFQKAFDRVWHTGLVHKLRTLGVQPNSVFWISSFLSDSTIAVPVGSCLSSQHTISAGVPQGSHLGPVLFLVFNNDLPDHVNIPTELYADDALLHHTFKRSTTALSVRGALQTAVLAAEQWALQWHGRFGHAKTKQLNIGQRQNLPLATVIEDHQIEEVVNSPQTPHNHFYFRSKTERTHTRGDWQCRKESRTSPMDVLPPTWPSHRPLVPRLCTPNNGLRKPPLAWFHS